MTIIEFIEFATVSTDRFVNKYRKQLRRDDKYTAMESSGKLSHDLLQFAELYQAFQPEYDMWDHRNIE